MVAPFVLRLLAYADHDILPKSVKTELEALPNFSNWAKATLQLESVLYIWDEETSTAGMKRKIKETKAKQG